MNPALIIWRPECAATVFGEPKRDKWISCKKTEANINLITGVLISLLCIGITIMIVWVSSTSAGLFPVLAFMTVITGVVITKTTYDWWTAGQLAGYEWDNAQTEVKGYMTNNPNTSEKDARSALMLQRMSYDAQKALATRNYNTVL